ncbi:MAG: arginase family protein [Candidatus Nomurabacteria bacterium]|nr:arginase family protein [Candidatus Nomurabacteria bacterium]
MDKKVLIIKSRSRLGMKYIPIGGTKLNLGVENAPDEVLTEDFLKKINSFSNIDFDFSLPEKVPDEEYYSFMANEIDDLSKKIEKEIKDNNINYIVNVGGDHSVASASLLSVIRSNKDKKVGVIMFDSHGDIHLKKTSPTGNYHGMWLRPFWDQYDDPEIQKIINVSLECDQLLFIGNLLLEEEEINFISKNKVKVFPSDKFEENIKENSCKQILDFCNNHDIVHVSFDIDVFSTKYVTATGTPNKDGFNKEMIFNIIDILKNNNKIFSLDLVEVNPKKEGNIETVKLAQDVIERFLNLQ